MTQKVLRLKPRKKCSSDEAPRVLVIHLNTIPKTRWVPIQNSLLASCQSVVECTVRYVKLWPLLCYIPYLKYKVRARSGPFRVRHCQCITIYLFWASVWSEAFVGVLKVRVSKTPTPTVEWAILNSRTKAICLQSFAQRKEVRQGHPGGGAN